MLLQCQLHMMGHVIKMPDGRLPHRVPYSQIRQGYRSVDGQKKHFKDHIMSILKKYVPFNRLEAIAFNRDNWRSTCAYGMSYFGAEYDRAAAMKRNRRHQHPQHPFQDSAHQCTLCGRQCYWLTSLHSHNETHSTMKRKTMSSIMDGLQKREEWCGSKA